MFLLPEQQLNRCTRVMQQRLYPYINTVLSHCKIRAYKIAGEPISSSEFFSKLKRNDIAFRSFNAPCVWGTTWGTTWFEVTGSIDFSKVKGRKVELNVDLGWISNLFPGFQAEGLVYNVDGRVIKAINPCNHWVPLIDEHNNRSISIDENGNFTLYLEAADNPFVEGHTPFSPTDLGERATGKTECQYMLKYIDVTVFNRNIFDYYMDLETVSSLMRELNDDNPRYWKLAKALQRSLNAYDEHDFSTVQNARKALHDVLSQPAASSSIKHTAVGHAHIDSAWQWPVRETHRKVARTISNVLALMDEDPDFTYAMSSAQQYEWLENEHPDLFERMKNRIKEGRFIPVGGMWVESDAMMPCGESLIRQMTFGKRYFKENLGVEPHGIWLPDSFGYTGALPQIARRAGFDWFLTQKLSWNDTTKFPHHSFLWEGIDGSRILAHFPPSNTYASSVSMHELVYSQRNFLDKDLSDHAILLYGFGDGGGGPTREMTARIRRDRNLEGSPRVDFGTPDELFEKIRKDIVDDSNGDTPVFKGELYLELHRKTLTSQQDMKRYCRIEESLLRVAEYLVVLARVYAPEYRFNNDELTRIWKTLLLNQFHDILPGSAIAWVHRQAREEYARDISSLRKIISDIANAIVKANSTIGAIGTSSAINMRENVKLLTYTGKNDVAWNLYQCNESSKNNKTTVKHKNDGGIILNNSVLSVTIERDGTVSSVKDIKFNRELIPSGYRMAQYEILKDEPYQWDAWDVERDAFMRNRKIDDSSIVCVKELLSGGVSVEILACKKDIKINTNIVLEPCIKRLDFHAQVDWKAKEQFLKVDMPTSICSNNAQYECQYGLVERPIVKNTRSDDAKFESCTHRFVRIEDSSYAVAVANSSTYGADVSPIGDYSSSYGTMLRLSLLSSPLYPDPNTDQGKHEFTWSFIADANMDSVLSAANLLNSPIIDKLPDVDPLFTIHRNSGLIALDWVKLADDCSGDIILRIHEPSGGYANGQIKLNKILRAASIEEVDLMEMPVLHGMPIALHKNNDELNIELRPFQLCSLRIHVTSETTVSIN
ncbi:alpha-mannosidase [Gardnerella pickettii]|uniref:alpha-mannosidase n=1 Tax=Gardnerella pickettii TaxID=2914924 RepID=UPI0039F0D53A